MLNKNSHEKIFLSGVLLLFYMFGNAQVNENIGRGEIALMQEQGRVFVSWRLLIDDPEGVEYDIYRLKTGEQDYVKINDEPVNTTYFIDAKAARGNGYRYKVTRRDESPDKAPGAFVFAFPYKTEYLQIKFPGNAAPRNVGIADLDGDGRYDYVVKSPDMNVDPYEKAGYWKRSEEPFKLKAYNADGKYMWTYDMGWSIETGTWYSPYLVFDIDGDGYAEVYAKAGEGDPRETDGHVMTGPEYLVKINGRTGEIEQRTDWLSREGFDRYNFWSRNFLTLGYLNGKKPSLILERGTYRLIKLAAFDSDLQQEWYWESTGQYENYKGQGQHSILTADIDDDGRDEIIIGMAAIDDNGKPLWTKGLGHNDVGHIADIDPGHPGLEFFYGMETSQKKYGVGLLDARSGKTLWTYDGSTVHVHSQGMVGDIDPDHPGMECYAGEAKGGSKFFLYSAQGELLSDKSMGTLDPRPVWWDADDQKEILINGNLMNYQGDTIMQIEGRVLLTADIIGDWREEIVTGLKGEIRIYSTTIPCETSKEALIQDRQYRLGVSRSTMGYYYPPQPGLNQE